MNRKRAERSGRRAETIAAWWLRMKGWAILARRIRTSRGEVDLIARRGRVLAFVEVKARSTELQAEHSLDEYRLRRVAGAADAIAHIYARPGDTLRIDAVYIVPGKLPRHRVDIWRG